MGSLESITTRSGARLGRGPLPHRLCHRRTTPALFLRKTTWQHTFASNTRCQPTAQLSISEDTVHDTLVVIVLYRSPIVHRCVDQIHDLLYACLLCEVREKAVVQGLEHEVRTLAKARKLGTSEHHPDQEHDA